MAHAIAEMSLFVEYTPRFQTNAASLSVDQLSEAFGNDFSIEPTQVQRVDVGPTGHSFTSENAFLLRKGGITSAPDWVVRVENMGLSVHCLNYSRWAQVWPEVLEYIRSLLSLIDLNAVEVGAIGLRYLDQFLYKDDPNDYNLGDLLKQSKFIHPFAFESGPRWHCHTGWFGNQEVLNQLHLTGVVPSPGTPNVADMMVAIDHAQIARRGEDKPLNGLLLGEELNQLGNHLHANNRSMMLELLQPNVSRRINLQGGTS